MSGAPNFGAPLLHIHQPRRAYYNNTRMETDCMKNLLRAD